MTPEDVARVAHEANRAYCLAIGDASQPAWEDAPDWQKSSALAGVHYHISHPDAKPADSHNSWLEQKRNEGWAFGRIKDPAAKLHPCFVPYDALPPEQKAKDYIYGAVVKNLIPHISSLGGPL